jgi:hypothetical protein
MATSSANPHKLRRYSQDGLDLIRTLRSQATAVDQAVRAMQRSGSSYVPGTDVPARLNDLVRDWYHLDEFVGDVAAGFFRANALRDDQRFDGPVMTFEDGMLGRLGRIGYADRDEAMLAARRIAGDLDRLRRGRATRADIQRFIASIGRGRYDPAFAVTFSQQVGVRGYVDAAALIRRAYSDGEGVPPEAIGAVRALSSVLTTALDTRPGIAAGDRHDPDNATLPDDQRLGDSFVQDLTTGWRPDPDGGVANPSHEGLAAASEVDLSVLMRYAEPPAAVAVAIANARMTPRLGGQYPFDAHHGLPWGDHQGPVRNYATMLARNPDVAAQWLTSGHNIEQVLQRPGSFDADGGRALADLVRVGVTHPDGALRRPVVGRAIDAVGREQEIHTGHMRGALVAGVESNMDVIDHRVNGIGWHNLGGVPEHDGRPELANTAIFLTELARDEAASDRVRAAALDYVNHEGLQSSRDGRSLGRILQITTQAEINVVTDEMNAGRDVRQRIGKFIDYGAGEIRIKGVPVGKIYSGITTASGTSLGDLLAEYKTADDSRREAILRELRYTRVEKDIRAIPWPGDKARIESGRSELERELAEDERYRAYSPDPIN